MNKDLGAWTYNDSAPLLIDYQNEMFETSWYETSADLADLNVRLLAKTAKAFNMPVVLSTVGVKYGTNGPTHASILSELPGVEAIDRTSMNAFEDRAFSEAVKKTGRKRLIFGGLHTEICLTFALVQALKDDYKGMFVVDAVGGRSQAAQRAAIERLAHRRRRAEHRARRRHRALPRLGVAAGRQSPRSSSIGILPRSRS